MERDKEIQELEKKIRVSFLSKALLNQALTHSSFAHEQNVPDNERLEFLGDAVLKLAITEYLYNKFPSLPEGDLTKFRASIVSDETLAQIATKMNLGHYLLLSENEKRTGGTKRKSNLGNAFEALVGAIYLDAGIGKARDFIVEHLRGETEKVSREGYIRDYKSTLQEFAQKRKWDLPHYRVMSELGPRHKRTFKIAVKLRGKIWGEGTGQNKKEAEQDAAYHAYIKLQHEEKPNKGIKGIISKVRKKIWIS